jgi:hypothetical protein
MQQCMRLRSITPHLYPLLLHANSNVMPGILYLSLCAFDKTAGHAQDDAGPLLAAEAALGRLGQL